MINRFILNEVSYFGPGAREVLPKEIARLGFKKAFVATDKDLIKFGVADKVLKVLADAGIPYEVFSDIMPNPTTANVKAGVAAFAASGADFIIALGGGSSMDTAKAIGIIIENPEFADVRSLEGVAPTKNHAVFTIAVPTTAGTAAEVTINYVITDVERKRKFVCVDPHDMPIIAVVDPEMMASMPKGLTASTGMDALTHAIEGYITGGAWELSDMFHIKAIEIIAKYEASEGITTIIPATNSEPPPLKSTRISIIIPTPIRKYGMNIAFPTKSIRRMSGDECGIRGLSTRPVMKAPKIPSMPASSIIPAPKKSITITKMYWMTLSL